MTAPTIAEYLKFANLQMAAEALFTLDATKAGIVLIPGEVRSGSIDPKVLTDGNRHASKFTTTEAEKFATEWEVVEHKSNTTTEFQWNVIQEPIYTDGIRHQLAQHRVPGRCTAQLFAHGD